MTIVLLLAFRPAVVFSQESPESTDSPKTTVDWTLESSHASLGSRNSDFYLRVRVRAAEVQKNDRQLVNLALVCDRSGSMDAEYKIGYVRKAAHLVVDNLTPQDHVSMIAFNQDVQVLAPLHPVVNREYLHHRIEELFAEGYTNLSAGFLEGCAQVRKRLETSGLHHVIVLTDGVANRGVWQPDALVELVGRSTRNGITVTTIGVGTEFNESLLSRMAQAGGGRYVYVQEPEEIPAAFARELGALLAVVAQNARLTIELPRGVDVERVFGLEDPQNPGRLEIPLGDLSSGEERMIVAKLQRRPAAGQAASDSLNVRGTLRYDDVSAGRRITADNGLTIERVREAGETTSVLEYARLVEAVDQISLAVSSMDRQVASQVLSTMRSEYPALKEAAQNSGDQAFVNKAFMFEHYARELQELIDRGALHEHSEARARLQKELHYRRYLMQHHRHDHQH